MKRLQWILGIAGLTFLFLQAVAADAPRSSALDAPRPIPGVAPMAVAQPAPPRAPAGGRETTGKFCDNSIDAGTSAACESEAGPAPGQNLLVCSNGNTPTNVNCSMPAGNCPTGTVCECKFSCGSLVLVE